MRATPCLFLWAAVLLMACGSAAADDVSEQNPPSAGKMIFNAQCAHCHGRKGDLGLSGAKDLTASTLDRKEVLALVRDGKGAMMGYGSQLKPNELEAVVDHVLTLRQRP